MMKTKPIPTTSSVMKMIAANERINQARSKPPGRRLSSHDRRTARSVVTAASRVVGCSSNEGAPWLPGSPGAPRVLGEPGASGGAGSGCVSGLGLVTATCGPLRKLINGDELVADTPDSLDASVAGGELLAKPG